MGGRWSKREVAILKLKYSETSWTELLQALPGRSKKSIEQKAAELGLTRPMFSTKKGAYFVYARCPVHGRIPRSDVIWEGKHLNIPKCPRAFCGRSLKVLPKSTKLREKYRDEGMAK